MSKKLTSKDIIKKKLNEDLAKEGKQINDEWFDSHFKVIRVSDSKDKKKEENND